MSFFRRPSSSCNDKLQSNVAKSNYLTPLDGLRGVSILLVIFFHAFFFTQYAFEDIEQFVVFSEQLPWFMAWIRRGDFGVDIFFVLSAFLIGSQLFQEQKNGKSIDLKAFYLKRFLRIYPVYLFALLLFSLAKGPNIYFLGNIFAYNNLFNLEKIVLPWSWSLSVEIQFYLLFPLLLLLIRRRTTAIVMGSLTLISSLVWMAYFYYSHPTLSQQSIMDLITLGRDGEQIVLYYMQYLYVVPPARISSFIFGVAAAYIWTHRQEALSTWVKQCHRQSRVLLFLVIVAIGLLMSFNIYQPHDAQSTLHRLLYDINMITGRFIFSSLIATLILLSLASRAGSITHRILSHKILYPVAKGSYAMYLFHPFFLFLAYWLLFGESKLTTFSWPMLLVLGALGSVLSLLFSWVTYHAIERWFSYSRFFNKADKNIT